MHILALALTFAAASPSEVELSFTKELAEVTIRAATPSKVFRMPAWAPGDYQLFNYGEKVGEMTFYKGSERVFATKEDPNTWKLESAADRAVYKVGPSRGNFSPNLQIRDTDVFVSPPGVIGRFDGTEKGPWRLKAGEHAVYTWPAKEGWFEAKNYDELLDSPFVVSDKAKVKEQLFGGKAHRIAIFGKNESLTPDSFLTVAVLAAEHAQRIFGELPYPSYTFYLDAGGPGGGLEHLNCTRIGIGPRATAQDSVGIMLHEYFHCFNVKRIRPEGLGPFDYSKPGPSATLWWLEGVTDYYADVLSVRAKFQTRQQLLEGVAFTERSISGAGYQQVSAEEAGRRVWEGRGSWGFGGVNYYTKGRQIGALLDLAIRGHSQGRRSLDDVMRSLYKETKGAKGYSPDRIRELCVEFGGRELGPIYDQAARKPGALPWAAALAPLRVEWQDGALVEISQSPIFRRWPESLTH